MAGRARDGIHRRPLLRAAVGTDIGSRLAGAGARRRPNDSSDNLSSPGKLALEPAIGLRCELSCDSVGYHFPGVADLAPSWAQGDAGTVVALGGCPLGLQPIGFRMLVLALGCWWPTPARFAPLPHRWRILISADGLGPGP